MLLLNGRQTKCRKQKYFVDTIVTTRGKTYSKARVDKPVILICQ